MQSPRPKPKVTVLGLYSPVANTEEYKRFVERRIEESDPANYTPETVEVFKRLGRNIPPPYNESDRQDVWEEYEHSLAESAVIEAQVENADATFKMEDFIQPDPSVREGWSQVAWQETHLTEDGEEVLSGSPFAPPVAPCVRVAFYIHSWRRRLGLLSSYGPLILPRQRPMPSRLWRLMPYEHPN
jgi:hypothetical protein